MCVIFACFEKWPSWRLLEQGAERNPDGLGVTWWNPDEKKVHWVKGLKSDVDELKRVMKDIKYYPAAIHFRIASVGGVRKDLTHPFLLDQTAPLALEGSTTGSVLMHNGHWNAWDNTIRDFCLRHKVPMPAGAWSDSRALAFIASFLGPHILPFLDDRDRMFVLPSDGRWSTYGHWTDPEKEHEETGFWISNNLLSGPRAHKSFPKVHGVTNHPTGWWDRRDTPENDGKSTGVDAKAPGVTTIGGGGSKTGLQVEIVSPGGSHREGANQVGAETSAASGKTRAGTLAPGGVIPKAGAPLESPATNVGGRQGTPLNAKSGGQSPGTSSTTGDSRRIVTLAEEERSGFEKEVWSMAELQVFLEQLRQGENGKVLQAS